LLAQATLEIGMGGPYNGVKICLFTNNIYPTRTNVLSDFTIANFGGLTNLQSITWGTPFLNQNQQAEVRGTLVNWLTTASTGLPITAYGYCITDTAGAVLIMAEGFAVPFTFSTTGADLAIIPRLVYDT
jgi:hypothetical protein